MLQQFKNMNELVEYLGALEKRIKTLELDNEKLRAIPSNRENLDGNAIAKYVSNQLPRTNILSVSFLKRAFAVWGHFFVANFIIGFVLGITYICLITILAGRYLGN